MTESSIYRSLKGKAEIMALYDRALELLNIEFEDRLINTRYGTTHVLVTGPENGEPLVIFHGGNVINPTSLQWFVPLMTRYRIYAPDTVGHPGKSSENRPSPKDNSYGEWVVDLLDGLGLEKASFIGPSYGGGILLRTAVYAPERINKAIFLVPSGIANGSVGKMFFKIITPMLSYRLFPSRKRLINAVQPMFTEVVDNKDIILKVCEFSFKHVKLEAEFPKLASVEELSRFNAPTLVIAAENDIFFPAKLVLPRAEVVFQNLTATECIKTSCHYPSKEGLEFINNRIKTFLDECR